jgi:hypothetical protein
MQPARCLSSSVARCGVPGSRVVHVKGGKKYRKNKRGKRHRKNKHQW